MGTDIAKKRIRDRFCMQYTSSDIIRLANSGKKWHILYTRPHHEKNIFSQLEKDNIEAYLPIQVRLKQWSDRKKKVTEPLFSCYLFVNILLKQYYKVLNVPGVIRYVWFEGKPAVLSVEKIEKIRKLVNNEFDLKEIEHPLHVGQKVMINTGPLSGIEGELALYSTRKRVIVRIEELNKCLSVNVPLNYLKLLK